MAAQTPSAVYFESAGSLNRYICTFGSTSGSIAVADTWASGLQGVLYASGNITTTLNTANNYGVAVAYVASATGTTFTIRGWGTETCTGLTLNILARQG